MEMNRREFLRLAVGGLTSLAFSNSIMAASSFNGEPLDYVVKPDGLLDVFDRDVINNAILGFTFLESYSFIDFNNESMALSPVKRSLSHINGKYLCASTHRISYGTSVDIGGEKNIPIEAEDTRIPSRSIGNAEPINLEIVHKDLSTDVSLLKLKDSKYSTQEKPLDMNPFSGKDIFIVTFSREKMVPEIKMGKIKTQEEIDDYLRNENTDLSEVISKLSKSSGMPKKGYRGSFFCEGSVIPGECGANAFNADGEPVGIVQSSINYGEKDFIGLRPLNHISSQLAFDKRLDKSKEMYAFNG